MKRSYSGNKLIMGLLGLMTIGAFAGVAIDRQRHSDAFMDQYRLQIEDVSPNHRTQRFVASAIDSEFPKMHYLPVNSENLERINGEWRITRINDQYGDDIYNIFESDEDRSREFIANFELISTSTVLINEDHEQVFQVSVLTDYNTIALFKRMEDGYELVEAKKVIEEVVPAPSRVDSISSQSASQRPVLPAGLRVDHDVHLVLERALHPTRSSYMLTGHAVSGELSLIDGTINDMRVSLSYENGQRDDFHVDFAEINDGGQFEVFLEDAAIDVIHGIITNNGEGVYRVRFATGPLQGAMLNFVTDAKYDDLATERYEEEDQLEEAQQFENNYARGNTQVFDQQEIARNNQAAEESRAAYQEQYFENDEDPYDTQEQYEQYYEDDYYKDDFAEGEDDSVDEYSDDYDYYSMEEMNKRIEQEVGFDFSNDRSVASLNEADL